MGRSRGHARGGGGGGGKRSGAPSASTSTSANGFFPGSSFTFADIDEEPKFIELPDDFETDSGE